MDTKAHLANRRKLNELAIQHNKLTTLTACLLNEVNALKKEVYVLKGGHDSSQQQTMSSTSSQQMMNSSANSNTPSNRNPNKFHNFTAEDILKQLSVNSSDN